MRDPVTIHVYSIEFLEKSGDEVTFKVHCSAGTYVRTLCHDIGQVLGCGAHVSALQRTRCGHFEIDAALPLEKVLELEADMVPQRSFVAMREALQGMPEITLSVELERKVCNGVSLSGPELPALCRETLVPGALVKLIAQDGRLLSIGSSTCSDGNDAILRPVRVFAH